MNEIINKIALNFFHFFSFKFLTYLNGGYLNRMTSRILKPRRANVSNTLPITPEKPDLKRSANERDSLLLTPPGSTTKRRKLFNELKTPIKDEKKTTKDIKVVTPSPSPQKLIFGKESIYSRTKSILQRSAGLFSLETGCLPTRESQFNKLKNFLDENIMNQTSNSLYITGPPGTGKTAQINAILQSNFASVETTLPKIDTLKNQSFYKVDGELHSVNAININCIALTSPKLIFQKIFDSFNIDVDYPLVKNSESLVTFMEKYKERTTFVVILDEMDQLLNNSVLDSDATRTIFQLFLMARSPSINFVLIGIANSLDLKDRFFARLNLEAHLLPETLVFHPYTSDEMFEIVMNRINTLKTDSNMGDEDTCIFQPMAIVFAAKKCATTTGDLRRLFDILRSAIEIVELQLLAKIKKENLTEFQIMKVGLPHVAKVFSQFLNSNSTRNKIDKLNMQQRIMLCALKHRENFDIFQSECSMDDGYDYYVKFLRDRDSLYPLKRTEFFEMANTLESCGVVTITHGRASGKTRQQIRLIKTCIDQKEFEKEVSKYDILKRFI